MFEAEYLQECERAELLGLPKPDKEGFMARRSGQMALARQIEEGSGFRARPESREVRIIIHEVSDDTPHSQDENKIDDEIDQRKKISSRLKRMIDTLEANNRAKDQARAEAANLEINKVEGDDGEMGTDSQRGPSTSAIPGTSTEEAQEDKGSRPSKRNIFVRLWRNIIHPKKAKK